jgi:hypothetical protein
MVLYGEDDLLSYLNKEEPSPTTEYSTVKFGTGSPKAGWFLAGRTDKWIPLPVNGYYSFSLSPERTFPDVFEFAPSVLSPDGTFSAGGKRTVTFGDNIISVSVMMEEEPDIKSTSLPLLSFGSLTDEAKEDYIKINKLLEKKLNAPDPRLVDSPAIKELSEDINSARLKINVWGAPNEIHYDAIIRLLLEENKLKGWELPHFPSICGLDPIMGGDDYILEKNQLLGYEGYALITSEMVYHAESSTVHARKFIEQMGKWAKPSPVHQSSIKAPELEEYESLVARESLLDQ